MLFCQLNGLIILTSQGAQATPIPSLQLNPIIASNTDLDIKIYPRQGLLNFNSSLIKFKPLQSLILAHCEHPLLYLVAKDTFVVINLQTLSVDKELDQKCEIQGACVHHKQLILLSDS